MRNQTIQLMGARQSIGNIIKREHYVSRILLHLQRRQIPRAQRNGQKKASKSNRLSLHTQSEELIIEESPSRMYIKPSYTVFVPRGLGGFHVSHESIQCSPQDSIISTHIS